MVNESDNYHVCLIFLFELMLNIPVTAKHHVATFIPFYGTFTKNEDIMISKKCFKYNHPCKPIRHICKLRYAFLAAKMWKHETEKKWPQIVAFG